jgi:hypothetical protein
MDCWDTCAVALARSNSGITCKMFLEFAGNRHLSNLNGKSSSRPNLGELDMGPDESLTRKRLKTAAIASFAFPAYRIRSSIVLK